MRTDTERLREVAPEARSPQAVDVDVDALQRRLEAVVDGEVRFDAKARGLYATDASNYRQVPIGVVIPRSKEDVIAAMAVCHEFGAPVLGRGGGTSLAGQGCNVGVVFDFSKYMNRVLEIDPDTRLARVEPGCVLDTLRDAANEHGLTFGPDPATHNRCTLGGMIGNNSCGVHSQMSGRTSDYVLELEVLTYDGARFWVGPTDDIEFREIMRAGGRKAEIHAALRRLAEEFADDVRGGFPKIPRRVSGYNLDDLLPERCNVARALVGSESTCVMVLEARLQLIPHPPERAILLIGWDDIYTVADQVPRILKVAEPVGLEAFDDDLVAYMRKKHLHAGHLALLPEGGGWMLVEFGADTREEAVEQARTLEAYLQDVRQDDGDGPPPSTAIYDGHLEMERIWQMRESGLGATARVPGSPDTWPGWEDAAVPPERLGEYLREFRALLDGFGYEASLYGHFGMGCVHTRIPFDLTSEEGVAAYRRFVTRAAHLVVSYGGSLSGEHGDGQARAELLSIMYGPRVLEAMRRFKAIWDPQHRMNPHKVVDPWRLDENLRLGPDFAPWEPETFFAFPEDEGSLSRAALRCVGVGLCRKNDHGTMCPSYMVTLEEEHSTRGRARLLHEMMQGEVVADKWGSEEVKGSLDLCIACKGCLGECPVNVDMATYKAEFLYHYHKTHHRPRHAYALGYVDVAARVASKMPRLANAVTQNPVLAGLAKRLGGIAPQRPLPPFTHTTFREWFDARDRTGAASRNGSTRPGTTTPEGARERVLFWPDTFSNHFHPHIAQAAVAVLEKAGCDVVLPSKPLCCGRPLYDYGMLPRARRLLERTVKTLRSEIRAGTIMVGVEPSCLATFRDELPNILPDDPDARRLSENTRTLAEFLMERPAALDRLHLDEEPSGTLDRSLRREKPKGAAPVLVQRHCHHQAVMGFDADRQLLDRIGLDYEVLDSGCCGLAGSFGFESGHYEISMKMGDRVLFPRLDAAAEATTVLADGFSCRTQIKDGTGRSGTHLAEFLADHLARSERSSAPNSLHGEPS